MASRAGEIAIATDTHNTITALRRRLLKCGYRDELVFADGYQFNDSQSVDLAAFAHEPLDARSACVAAIKWRASDPKQDVLGRRGFGAPVVFVCGDKAMQVWSPGPSDARLIEGNLSLSQLPRFFEKNENLLTPTRIYAAKTIGRLNVGRQAANEFVDADLLPFAERQVGERLVQVVEEVVDDLQKACTPSGPDGKLDDDQQVWVLKSTFRLLAGRVLKDKGVPNFKTLRLADLKDVFEKVREHYGSRDEHGVELGDKKQRAALDAAAERFGDLTSLRHLTTEALADVYERALVDKDTRKISGTHRTPSYLADYMVWQLAPWISKEQPDQLRVFEAACGHAPFLVAAMRLLRTMDLKVAPDRLSPYFRQRLAGIDYDAFAVEVARLSLTMADVPRRNGWHEVRNENMFGPSNALAREASACRVLLSNPPFEDFKPMRMLDVALRNLQPGAAFGVIVPTAQLFTKDRNKQWVIDLRKWMLRNCQLSEVTLLPDGIFEHADQEVALVLGRRAFGTRAPMAHVKCRRVREDDLEEFQERYKFSSDRVYPQNRFAAREDQLPWVEELDEEVWSLVRRLPRLKSIADVGQGLVHHGQNLPLGTETVSETKFPGAVLGLVSMERDLGIDELPGEMWMNLAAESIRRPGTGTEMGTPQVLLNYAPVSRGVWRLKALVDPKGHPVTSRFLTVRPREASVDLLYLWAICNSPVSNAYAYTHSLKRDILAGMMRELPVPDAAEPTRRRVSEAARAYLDACGQREEASLFSARSQLEIPVGELHRRLRIVDAEVLRLYDLPSRAERKLLAMFTAKRPGVPGEFRGYYPRGAKQSIPLYVFMSRTYQRFQRDGSIELPPGVAERFDALVEKHAKLGLTPDELADLEVMQAEIAGRDYASTAPTTGWADDLESREEATRLSLAKIANRLAELPAQGKRRGR